MLLNTASNNPQARNKASTRLAELLARGVLWQAESASTSSLSRSLSLTSTLSSNIPFGIDELDASIAGGLRSGCLHEFYCAFDSPTKDSEQPLYAATTIPALLAAQVLRRADSNRLLIWIGKSVWPTPFILQAIENSPAIFSRCIFLDPPNRALHLWAIETALRSPQVALTVFSVPPISLRTAQRFSLAAKDSGATAILLAPPQRLTRLSSAHSRWQLSPCPTNSFDPRWLLQLHALKAAPKPPLCKWLVEISLDVQFPQRALDYGEERVSINLLPKLVDSGSAQRDAQGVSASEPFILRAG